MPRGSAALRPALKRQRRTVACKPLRFAGAFLLARARRHAPLPALRVAASAVGSAGTAGRDGAQHRHGDRRETVGADRLGPGGGKVDEAGSERASVEALDRMNNSGRLFVSATRLRGHYGIRVALGNGATEWEHVSRVLEYL